MPSAKEQWNIIYMNKNHQEKFKKITLRNSLKLISNGYWNKNED